MENKAKKYLTLKKVERIKAYEVLLRTEKMNAIRSKLKKQERLVAGLSVQKEKALEGISNLKSSGMLAVTESFNFESYFSYIEVAQAKGQKALLELEKEREAVEMDIREAELVRSSLQKKANFFKKELLDESFE